MDIVRERLEREYDLELLATTPNVRYEVELRGGERIEVHSPAEMPDPAAIERILEPYIRATMIAPAVRRRGDGALPGPPRTHVDMHYLSPERVQLRYDLPLAEIVLDFYDQLKSRTAGYASLDYEQHRQPRRRISSSWTCCWRATGSTRCSVIVHSDEAYRAGRALVERLQKTIPRQLFDVPVQAAIGSRVLARETVKALRKDVTAKLYGGDVTRKRKLLEKQKAGKKRMKQVGKGGGAAGGVPLGAGARWSQRAKASSGMSS